MKTRLYSRVQKVSYHIDGDRGLLLSSEISALVRLSKHEDNFLYHGVCLCLVSMNFLKILIAYFIFVLLKKYLLNFSAAL